MSENYFLSYHGTDKDNVPSIRKSGFNTSDADHEWLGSGSYFFTEGVTCPIENAREWAKSAAWNNTDKINNYGTYSVLEVVVSGEKVLDLRETEDINIYNQTRSDVIQSHKKRNKSYKNIDTAICNAIINLMKIDILIKDSYIKSRFERKYRIESRVPNCTVLCATKTAQIFCDDMNEYEIGEVA